MNGRPFQPYFYFSLWLLFFIVIYVYWSCYRNLTDYYFQRAIEHILLWKISSRSIIKWTQNTNKKDEIVTKTPILCKESPLTQPWILCKSWKKKCEKFFSFYILHKFWFYIVQSKTGWNKISIPKTNKKKFLSIWIHHQILINRRTVKTEN